MDIVCVLSHFNCFYPRKLDDHLINITKYGSHIPGKTAALRLGIWYHTHQTCHEQCKRQFKTVYLIPKRAKVYFKNEQCSLDEFGFRCIKTEPTERESANYSILQLSI